MTSKEKETCYMCDAIATSAEHGSKHANGGTLNVRRFPLRNPIPFRRADFPFDGLLNASMFQVPRQAGQQQSSSWRSSWLRAEPISLGSFNGSGIAVYRKRRTCRSLIVWFRISNSTHDVEIRNEIRSQRKLNCALPAQAS